MAKEIEFEPREIEAGTRFFDQRKLVISNLRNGPVKDTIVPLRLVRTDAIPFVILPVMSSHFWCRSALLESLLEMPNMMSIVEPETEKGRHLDPALQGKTLMCLGNTELTAGSDVANVACQAGKVEGGWLLNGSKAYVTNGAISDLALITAISDPEAERNRRLSMFLVDLSAEGVSRRKLHKQV